MNAQEIVGRVDHTLLKATATWEEIQTLCKEAIQYHTASVCIPPCYVKRASDTFGEALVVCTVVGFPLGYNSTEAKVFEARQAIADGAKEVDMVVNLGDVKDGSFEKVTDEIAALKKAVGSHVLKVIVETCYLTQTEKEKLCQCITRAKADYIKTSTGFGTAGAQLEDIALFKRHIGSEVKVKASGGIRTREDFIQFAEAGCDRIGASAAIQAFGEGG